jgi:hypothetical protein
MRNHRSKMPVKRPSQKAKSGDVFGHPRKVMKMFHVDSKAAPTDDQQITSLRMSAPPRNRGGGGGSHYVTERNRLGFSRSGIPSRGSAMPKIEDCCLAPEAGPSIFRKRATR